MDRLFEKKTPISAIYFQQDGKLLNVKVEQYGVDNIICYEENGEMAPVAWFSIHREGKEIARVNGKYVMIVDYTGDFAENDGTLDR